MDHDMPGKSQIISDTGVEPTLYEYTPCPEPNWAPIICFTQYLLSNAFTTGVWEQKMPKTLKFSYERKVKCIPSYDNIVVVVVVLTLPHMVKSVVTGQPPVTAELRNTPGKRHKRTKCGTRIHHSWRRNSGLRKKRTKVKSGVNFFFFFPFQHTFTLQLLDKPWSQVSSLLLPGSCLQFLSRIGFSNPTARRLFIECC